MTKDTVVVGAQRAWPEYQKYAAYICQSGRSFQPVEYIAFYLGGEIQPVVPKIVGGPQEVIFERGRYEGRMGELVDKVLSDGNKAEGVAQRVFLLSDLEDFETAKLEGSIRNDLVNSIGKRMAFTRNQRYVSLFDLRRVAEMPEETRRTSGLG